MSQAQIETQSRHIFNSHTDDHDDDFALMWDFAPMPSDEASE